MAQRDHAPILVLSNRLPFTVQRTGKGLERKPSSGGLVSALEPILRLRGGEWIGWPGLALKEGEAIPSDGDQPYGVEPVSLTDTEANRYYHGFSNRTLWPVFHSLPARAVFDGRGWAAYEKVNERFAKVAIPAPATVTPFSAVIVTPALEPATS